MNTYLILALALLAIKLYSDRKKTAITSEVTDRVQTVQDVVSTTLSAVENVIGQVRRVTDYGTSQGINESEVNQISPGDTAAANPDGAKTSLTSSRSVRTGPVSISAFRSSPISRKKRPVLPMPLKSRVQERGAKVPYNPYGRPSSVDVIKRLMNS